MKPCFEVTNSETGGTAGERIEEMVAVDAINQWAASQHFLKSRRHQRRRYLVWLRVLMPAPNAVTTAAALLAGRRIAA